jgi:hypothetical protein
MATVTKNYLDITGLQSYDQLIKGWVNGSSNVSTSSPVIFRTILYDSENIYFYHKAEATSSDRADVTVPLGGSDVTKALAEITAIVTSLGGTMDTSSPYTVTFPALTTTAKDTLVNAINELDSAIDTLNGDNTVSGSVAKSIKDAIEALTVNEFAIATNNNGVITIHGISETNGVIAPGVNSINDIELVKVATTGKAEDVSIDDLGYKLTATNVEDALAELADSATAKKVYMTDDTSTSGTDYAAIYKIYQGTGSTQFPQQNELIGTINIPQDQFVDSAGVDITYNDGHLYDGYTDVTELIKGAGGTATAADAGKYVKLVFSIPDAPTKGKSTIYISVKDLAHVYTGGTTAEIAVSVDTSTDVITASIIAIAATKVNYTESETVGAALTRLDGAASVQNSVSNKIATAIGGLDTQSDIPVAAYDSATTNITLSSGISEANGIIGAGTGDDIVISPISTTAIDSLFV